MAEEPKDLTIGQVSRETQVILAQASPDIEKVKKAIDSLLSTAYVGHSPDGHVLLSKTSAIKAGIDSGLITAEDAVNALQKLLKEFSFPLAIVGGVKLEGSGVLAKDAAGALQGLTTSMTQVNKVLNIIVGILYILCSTYTAVTAVFPAVGDYKIGLGGLALSTLFGGIARLIGVWNSNYPDAKAIAPRAQIVVLPK